MNRYFVYVKLKSYYNSQNEVVRQETWEAFWCGHEVQAPNYTHVQEEEQKEDSPTCGLMDGAYQLLGLKLSKPEHLMIKVSLGFLYAFLLLVI